jgi:hypothetical protein
MIVAGRIADAVGIRRVRARRRRPMLRELDSLGEEI